MIVEPACVPAVTIPAEFTVAMAEFAEDHVIALLVALDGRIVATSVFIEPVFSLNNVGERDIDVTDTVMVKAQVAISVPLTVVAVIIAEPAEIAVTTPDEFTITFAELDCHVTLLFVALEGVTVAINVSVLVG